MQILHVKPNINVICTKALTREFKELNPDQERFLKNSQVKGVRLEDNSLLYIHTGKIAEAKRHNGHIELLDEYGCILYILDSTDCDLFRILCALA